VGKRIYDGEETESADVIANIFGTSYDLWFEKSSGIPEAASVENLLILETEWRRTGAGEATTGLSQDQPGVEPNLETSDSPVLERLS